MPITRYAVDPFYQPPAGYASSKKTSFDALTELKFEIIYDSTKESTIRELHAMQKPNGQVI